MQNKQKKACFQQQLTPWDYQPTQQSLQPTHRQNSHISKMRHKRKAGSYSEPMIEKIDMVNEEEVAKETLLDIQSEHNYKKIQQLKYYMDIRKKENSQNSMPTGIAKIYFKLLHITSKHEHLDSLNSLVLRRQSKDKDLEESIFRKYGEHRKQNAIEQGMKVQRTVNFLGKYIKSKDMQANPYENKQKTVEPQREYQLPKRLKKYRQKSHKFIAPTKETINGEYTHHYSNITPHELLFGHSQQYILQRVLLQLQHKVT